MSHCDAKTPVLSRPDACQDHDSRTSATLLLRLRDLSDADAWNDFVNRYAPKIYQWCRHHHLQEADAADVTQEVLGKLVNVIGRFDYDPGRGSFRAWLKTVANNTVRDTAKRWSVPGRPTGAERVALCDPGALDALVADLEAETEREMLREANERVKLRVKRHTWQAYWATAVEGRSAGDVARALGISIGDVYVAKSRVVKMLRREVQLLDSAPALSGN